MMRHVISLLIILMTQTVEANPISWSCKLAFNPDKIIEQKLDRAIELTWQARTTLAENLDTVAESVLGRNLTDDEAAYYKQMFAHEEELRDHVEEASSQVKKSIAPYGGFVRRFLALAISVRYLFSFNKSNLRLAKDLFTEIYEESKFFEPKNLARKKIKNKSSNDSADTLEKVYENIAGENFAAVIAIGDRIIESRTALKRAHEHESHLNKRLIFLNERLTKISDTKSTYHEMKAKHEAELAEVRDSISQWQKKLAGAQFELEQTFVNTRVLIKLDAISAMKNPVFRKVLVEGAQFVLEYFNGTKEIPPISESRYGNMTGLEVFSFLIIYKTYIEVNGENLKEIRKMIKPSLEQFNHPEMISTKEQSEFYFEDFWKTDGLSFLGEMLNLSSIEQDLPEFRHVFSTIAEDILEVADDLTSNP